MKKQTITLIFFQLLISTIVMMAEANTVGFELEKNKDESAGPKDLEIESNQERDVFPDLITFATHLYQ
jgi:hypothetical protein